MSSDSGRPTASAPAAISAEGLSKRYRLGTKSRIRMSFRESLSQGVGRLLSRGSKDGAGKRPTVWALKDVSFEVQPGEVLGIIGRNGAGKSTLLKLLARITEPTEGSATIRGSVGSILEVGTGFHGELTGRENVFLNGAILGMSRRDIMGTFDSIVSFAGLESFIDTPVKYYSSGMQVRLAFAVAAHLEPQILIVDEVLAVGDASFQKKCLGRMGSVASEGRTVLFVSHNMSAVSRLCSRVLLLEEGRLVLDGPTQEVVGAYLNAGTGTAAEQRWQDPATAPQGGIARLRSVAVRDERGHAVEDVTVAQRFCVEIEFDVLKGGRKLLPYLVFENDNGAILFTSVDIDPEWQGRERPAGRFVSRAWMPANVLTVGRVFIGVGLQTIAPAEFQYYEPAVVAVRIHEETDPARVTARGAYAGSMYGVVRPRLDWSTVLDSRDPADPGERS